MVLPTRPPSSAVNLPVRQLTPGAPAPGAPAPGAPVSGGAPVPSRVLPSPSPDHFDPTKRPSAPYIFVPASPCALGVDRFASEPPASVLGRGRPTHVVKLTGPEAAVFSAMHHARAASRQATETVSEAQGAMREQGEQRLQALSVIRETGVIESDLKAAEGHFKQAETAVKKVNAFFGPLSKGVGGATRESAAKQLRDLLEMQNFNEIAAIVDAFKISHPEIFNQTNLASFIKNEAQKTSDLDSEDLSPNAIKDFIEKTLQWGRLYLNSAGDALAARLNEIIAKNPGMNLGPPVGSMSAESEALLQRAEGLTQQANALEKLLSEEDKLRRSAILRQTKEDSLTLGELNKNISRLEKLVAKKIKVQEYAAFLNDPANNDPDKQTKINQQTAELQKITAAEEELQTLTQQRLAVNQRIDAGKNEMNHIMGPILSLREESGLLRQQAKDLVDSRLSAFRNAVVDIRTAAEQVVEDSYKREGEIISGLVENAVDVSYSGMKLYKQGADKTTIETRKAHLAQYQKTRHLYYQMLSAAAQLYNASVDSDKEAYEANSQHIGKSKQLLKAHKRRVTAQRGMTLPEEQKGRGLFYTDMPEGLNLPDRIPLFARPVQRSAEGKSVGKDAAYIGSGEMPRYFDIALGTAVMFQHPDEILPTDQAILLDFHGATTQNSSINSLGYDIGLFNTRFADRTPNNTPQRLMATIGFSNPFHDLGPHDPALYQMPELIRWVSAIVERYGGYDKPIELKGRSFGANLVLEYRQQVRDSKVRRVYAQSGYNATPYWLWEDFKSLRERGRQFYQPAVDWLKFLESQWTFLDLAGQPPNMQAVLLVGLKDDYVKKSPAQYPEDFLTAHPEFRDRTPDEIGLLSFWLSFLTKSKNVDARFYRDGGHFLYNADFESPHLIAQVLQDLDAYFRNNPQRSDFPGSGADKPVGEQLADFFRQFVARGGNIHADLINDEGVLTPEEAMRLSGLIFAGEGESDRS
ncbi:MAG: hypothetical protein HQM16_02445 [Deltaproteobacteria bacterium]|nr:hypothetical protein [Deltaproteobacteria bacterium]